MRAPLARVEGRPTFPLKKSNFSGASFPSHLENAWSTSSSSGLLCKSTEGMAFAASASPPQVLHQQINTSLEPKQNCSASDLQHREPVWWSSQLPHRCHGHGSVTARPPNAVADPQATSSAPAPLDGQLEMQTSSGFGNCAPAVASTATALLLLAVATPEPLLRPAVARIPTEVVLSEGGGPVPAAAAGSGRSALLQLAAPPSAVLAPAGAAAFPPAELEAESGPGGATRGSNSGSGRAVIAPGSMVGTPNYARGPGAARPGLRSTASEAAEALQLLTSAREAVDCGQHDLALELYGRLVSEHPDLALAEYGRIGRAMMLYQVGRTSDSILALEDEEVSMRGAAEVHAALAALLYTERPNLALRAEEEWNLAGLFDRRYSDTEWVRVNKHWPPRMIAALQKFLSLSPP
ncbi:hypothetical protein Vafri_19239 [Volvox africanus]|uniref:Uncharacterized protein n=1 Tax=Volvox africanus TaxID=51714 RepID=A0A8J4BQ91_9CHLO|nr:hypothetical protein Vafri_19239 [Volvox africanus]